MHRQRKETVEQRPLEKIKEILGSHQHFFHFSLISFLNHIGRLIQFLSNSCSHSCPPSSNLPHLNQLLDALGAGEIRPVSRRHASLCALEELVQSPSPPVCHSMKQAKHSPVVPDSLMRLLPIGKTAPVHNLTEPPVCIPGQHIRRRFGVVFLAAESSLLKLSGWR